MTRLRDAIDADLASQRTARARSTGTVVLLGSYKDPETLPSVYDGSCFGWRETLESARCALLLVDLAALVVSAYFTAVETQAELTVQAAGYDQVTAHCRLTECSWVGRSKLTGGWETGTAWCDPFTLDCEVRR